MPEGEADAVGYHQLQCDSTMQRRSHRVRAYLGDQRQQAPIESVAENGRGKQHRTLSGLEAAQASPHSVGEPLRNASWNPRNQEVLDQEGQTSRVADNSTDAVA